MPSTKANEKIKKIAQTYDKDLLIETFADIPADLKKDYKPENKKEFFEKWARDQAHENAVNGVYVLICKKPSHLQVEVGNETQKKAFTLRNRNELAKLLIDKFKEKKYDEGLQEAVDFYATTLKANLGKSAGTRFKPQRGMAAVMRRRSGPLRRLRARHAARRESASGLGLHRRGGAAGTVAGVRADPCLYRSRTRRLRRRLRGRWVRRRRGRRRCFLSSLMGGMFGAAAGMWMYDHFSAAVRPAWAVPLRPERLPPGWTPARPRIRITPARAAISAAMTAEVAAAISAAMMAAEAATLAEMVAAVATLAVEVVILVEAAISAVAAGISAEAATSAAAGRFLNRSHIAPSCWGSFRLPGYAGDRRRRLS